MLPSPPFDPFHTWEAHFARDGCRLSGNYPKGTFIYTFDKCAAHSVTRAIHRHVNSI
jgi:hypothetical protein